MSNNLYRVRKEQWMTSQKCFKLTESRTFLTVNSEQRNPGAPDIPALESYTSTIQIRVQFLFKFSSLLKSVSIANVSISI